MADAKTGFKRLLLHLHIDQGGVADQFHELKTAAQELIEPGGFLKSTRAYASSSFSPCGIDQGGGLSVVMPGVAMAQKEMMSGHHQKEQVWHYRRC